ncbi:MAG: indole-3-glycerol phosphate synthase TrpC [Planctomycetota bacterium]
MPERDVLSRIVEQKHRELVDLRSRAQAESWREDAERLPPPRSFLAELRGHHEMRVIAEIKKASPSAGVIRPDFDPPAIAKSYASNGAACLSVLTDETFFQGSIDDLRSVHQSVSLPLLRKDFILDPVQIYQAKIAGASAVLLIAECLAASEMADLLAVASALGMTTLVELYDPANLDPVLRTGTPLIGINNRNLRTFVTDLAHTLDLLADIPSDRTVVSESGIRSPADIARLREAGVHAVLVGETFMRAADPGRKLAELMGR